MGWVPTPEEWGAPSYYFTKKNLKLHESEKNWGRASLAPPLNPPVDVFVSALGSEISPSRGDIYGQCNFSTGSTLTDLVVLLVCEIFLVVKCHEVQN